MPSSTLKDRGWLGYGSPLLLLLPLLLSVDANAVVSLRPLAQHICTGTRLFSDDAIDADGDGMEKEHAARMQLTTMQPMSDMRIMRIIAL